MVQEQFSLETVIFYTKIGHANLFVKFWKWIEWFRNVVLLWEEMIIWMCMWRGHQTKAQHANSTGRWRVGQVSVTNIAIVS